MGTLSFVCVATACVRRLEDQAHDRQDSKQEEHNLLQSATGRSNFKYRSDELHE